MNTILKNSQLANPTECDPGFEELFSMVAVGLVEAPAVGLNPSLDIRSTIFHQGVWQAPREIPAGSTPSYTDIANRIGCPNRIRDIDKACIANVGAMAIPCHRLMKKDEHCLVIAGEWIATRAIEKGGTHA